MEPARQPGAAAAWSARSVGAEWQHRFFYFLIRRGGRRAAYGCLRAVAAYYVVFRPAQRRKTRWYLDRRFPGRGPAGRLADSYRHIVALGESLIDRAMAGILGPGSVRTRFEGREELARLVGEGRGLVLVGAHVGGWQAVMPELAMMHLPVHLLMRLEDGDVYRRWHEQPGAARPWGIIDPEGYLGGSLEMLAALRRGEVLCVMGDRVFGSARHNLAVDFLGRRALFPCSPYKVAAAAGAPVGVLLTAKTGPAEYTLRLAAVMRPAAGVGGGAEAHRACVEGFVHALEEHVARWPYQFFNFYDLWAAGAREGDGA